MDNSTVFAKSVVPVDGVGEVTVTTFDFSMPGYELCGFESVVRLPSGVEYGTGPDNGESPAELHAVACDPAEIKRWAL